MLVSLLDNCEKNFIEASETRYCRGFFFAGNIIVIMCIFEMIGRI